VDAGSLAALRASQRADKNMRHSTNLEQREFSCASA
jgi:hypothetical protein